MTLGTLLRRLTGMATSHPGLRGERDFVATHRHRKGGDYRLLARGILESDRSAVAIYDDAEGTIWVRDLAEFEDGRFTEILPSHRA